MFPRSSVSGAPGSTPEADRPGVGRRYAVAVAGVTLLALALRVIALDSQLWYDEIVTLVESVRPPLAEIVVGYHWNNKHPLNSVLGHLSVTTFGERPWALRLPAMLFGVACVPMLYLCGTAVATRREALLAALLLAVAYHHVWYSQSARGYTMLMFFTLLCTWLLLRGIERGGWPAFLAYAVAAALGAYTHLTMVFVVAGHAAACLLRWRIGGADAARPWLATAAGGFVAAGLLTVALHAPMLQEMADFFTRKPSAVGQAVATPSRAAGELLAGLAQGVGGAAPLLAIVGGLLLVGGLDYLRRNWFFVALVVLPVLVTAFVALGLKRPVHPRFLFSFAGFGLLVLVRGCWVAGQGFAALLGKPTRGVGWGTALALAIVAASIWPLSGVYAYPKQDFQGPLRLLDRAVADGDRVVAAGLAAYPYQRYYHRPFAAVDHLADLRPLQRTRGRVWLIYTLPHYVQASDPELWAVIERDFEPAACYHGTLGGGDVSVVRSRPAPDLLPGKP